MKPHALRMVKLGVTWSKGRSLCSVSSKLCDSLCNCWHFSWYFTADHGATTLVSATKLMMFSSVASSHFLSVVCMPMPLKKKKKSPIPLLEMGKVVNSFNMVQCFLAKQNFVWKKKRDALYRWGPWMLGTAHGFTVWWHVRMTHCSWHGHVLASKSQKKSCLLLWKVSNS